VNSSRIGKTIITALASVMFAGAASAETFRIEIDYMGPAPDGHDHRPSQLVLDAVIQMFACQGHTLIIDLSDEIPHYDSLTGNPDSNCGQFFTYTGQPNTYASIRSTYRNQVAGWHYAIFAHQYMTGSPDPDDPNTPPGCYPTTSSGLANGGDAFIVSLGAFSGQTGTLFQQAATLAHEFGHNLGLSHCGTCAGNSPYLLNMPSIMTYQYQLDGVRTGLLALGLMPEVALFKELAFSHGRMCALDEAGLDEIRGTLMMSVDFNCDGDTNETGVVQDLNVRGFGIGPAAPWCSADDVAYALLEDYNEWASLDDGATLVARAAGGDNDARFQLAERRSIIEPCITREEWDELAWRSPPHLLAPALAVEPCIGGQNIYIGDFSGYQTGRCASPYASIQAAQAAAPNGSVYYIAPGIYDEPGVTILNKPGVYTCNTGTAVIR
jgi:hypothetical protein